jgi:hypothetical protein
MKSFRESIRKCSDFFLAMQNFNLNYQEKMKRGKIQSRETISENPELKVGGRKGKPNLNGVPA